MLRKLRKLKAQSVGEYAIMISIVILAIVGMTYFIQRGFSARINDARGYMLTTLDAEIKNVHISRGGNAYYGILAEYEPYYINKFSRMEPVSASITLINGVEGKLVEDAWTTTLMNSISTENPAQDDDYSQPPSSQTSGGLIGTNPN